MLTIDEIKSKIAPVCMKYDIQFAYLFGSYARGEATEKSDVDIRIEAGNSKKLSGLLQVCICENELADSLQKRVHLLTMMPQDEINSIIRKNIMSDEVLIYGNQ
ncbi:MAG: nucleotidyltransferase domain-containing protein [Selenomonadaceae bacterium]|nr:nucleotidyltransferase domain-containing protein [Selenomonadaceae bacterium]